MSKLSVEQTLRRAVSHEKKGDLVLARSCYQSILAEFPSNQRAQKALDRINHLPPVSLIDKKHLIGLHKQGLYQEVIDHAHDLQRHYSLSETIWNTIGASYQALNEIERAKEAFNKSIQIQPDYANGHYNLGVMHNIQGDYETAIKNYYTTLKLNPDHFNAYDSLGNIFFQQGDYSLAQENYKRCINLKPEKIDTIFNLGRTMQALGDLVAAEKIFRHALTIDHNYAEAHNSLGNVLMKQHNDNAAIESFNRALDIKPDYAIAHNNLALAYQKTGLFDQALSSIKHALSLQPDYVKAQHFKLSLQSSMCDWSIYTKQFTQDLLTLGIKDPAISLFSILALEDNPERQHQRAITWASKKFQHTATPLPTKSKTQGKKIRIGYFSADFHDHPMMYLMSGLFRCHDQNNFEIYAYSYGPPSSHPLCKKMRQDLDGFYDIREFTDKDVVKLAREHKLDIAIDRKGYTENSRSELFAYRLAPVQISYLAYASTMGAPFMDYLVADKTIIPDEQRSHYSESIIYLPDTYQPNDDQREIAITSTKRIDFGLPENGFVFCCFNNNFKITPQEFDIWMRCLKQIDNSVLWLLNSNKWMKRNLCREAELRGVDAERLVFANRVPHADHLARHKHADLFVDTFNYNAHTTASDALWSGLPVVTKMGSQFSARVSASLLFAVGLPELVTESKADYEALIFSLATDTDRLAIIKSKLEQQRLTQPLFNTKKYTLDLEEAYRQAYSRSFHGQCPADIQLL